MNDRNQMEALSTASEAQGGEEADRREFLAALGRFSAVTPPSITLLLSTTLASNAIAKSGSTGGGHKKWPW